MQCLLCLLEWLQSIVMSMSVCVCVSVYPRGYLRNHTRYLYQICVHVAYVRGSVLLRYGDDIPRGRGNFGGFLPHRQCIVQHSIWDHTKTAEPIEIPFWMMSGLGPRNSDYMGVTIPVGEGAVLGESCARQA